MPRVENLTYFFCYSSQQYFKYASFPTISKISKAEFKGSNCMIELTLWLNVRVESKIFFFYICYFTMRKVVINYYDYPAFFKFARFLPAFLYCERSIFFHISRNSDLNKNYFSRNYPCLLNL